MPPIVRKGLKSKQSRGLLGDARTAWTDGHSDAATELATRVFLAEGRDAFGPSDKALFAAMLARLEPPAGYRNWDAYFASGTAGEAPEPQEQGKSPLHDAASAGDLAQLEALLGAGVDANLTYKRRDLRITPLFEAVVENQLAAAKRLLAAGARVDGKDQEPVVMGVKSVPMAELLIEHGAKLDVVDSSGRTVFARIVDTLGRVPLAELVAKKSPMMKDEKQRKVLERAMSQSSPELREVAEKFLARKR